MHHLYTAAQRDGTREMLEKGLKHSAAAEQTYSIVQDVAFTRMAKTLRFSSSTWFSSPSLRFPPAPPPRTVISSPVPPLPWCVPLIVTRAEHGPCHRRHVQTSPERPPFEDERQSRQTLLAGGGRRKGGRRAARLPVAGAPVDEPPPTERLLRCLQVSPRMVQGPWQLCAMATLEP
ncbi:unnamed protein product [Gadus morhua 'NCC']